MRLVRLVRCMVLSFTTMVLVRLVRCMVLSVTIGAGAFGASHGAISYHRGSSR